jgi:SAM-dependent methyltransferase
MHSSPSPAHSNWGADIPYGEDFHDPVAAQAWAHSASVKRPHRREFFDAFLAELDGLPRCERILELGSGPGFLAGHILANASGPSEYTLLDFSDPMLEQSRERLLQFTDRTRFVKADFRKDDWVRNVSGTFDAIVTMQAVHELRHKRYAHRLFQQLGPLLTDSGILLFCDHHPGADPPSWKAALYMSLEEQQIALLLAGFWDVTPCLVEHDMALLRGAKPVI